MFQKLLAVLAVFAFFALFSCSSDDNDEDWEGSPSSSSQGDGGGDSSSSLDAPSGPVTDYIASFNNNASIFGTYGYGYTLKAGAAEDLTQFWDVSEECPVESQTTAPPATCELDKTNAMLQNALTNQYADLHYKIDGVSLGFPNAAIELKQYNLSEESDQAALGLDVGEAPKDISLLNGLTEFIYRYWGGAHAFRVLTDKDEDFWFVQTPASADTVEIKILPSEFEGTGSLEGSPLDLSKAKKFLWVVEYAEGESNAGTLLIDHLKWTKE
jgi:hypothetical protein